MFDCLAHSKSTGNTSYYNHLLPLLEIIMAFKSAEWILQLRDLGLPNPIVDSGHHFLASSSGRFHITSNEKYIFWHHSWKSEKLGCSKRPVLETSFTPSRNRISESYHWRTLNTHSWIHVLLRKEDIRRQEEEEKELVFFRTPKYLEVRSWPWAFYRLCTEIKARRAWERGLPLWVPL